MNVAVIGSRSLTVDDLCKYLPTDTTEIISGSALLRRNTTIIEKADLVIAFWDGVSHGTKDTIDKCQCMEVTVRVYKPEDTEYFQKALDKPKKVWYDVKQHGKMLCRSKQHTTTSSDDKEC